nr:MAG: capsid protein [Flaviviridae sp.]
MLFKHVTTRVVIAVLILGCATTESPGATPEDLTGSCPTPNQGAEPFDYTGKSCKIYSDDWRVAQCASAQRQKGLITKTMFNSYLDYAKAMSNKVTDTYWSVGLSLGASTKLVMAKQEDPTFKTSFKVDLDPRNVYHQEMYLDLVRPVDKTILLYLEEPIDGIPELRTNLPSIMHPAGNPDQRVRVYRYGPLDTESEGSCSHFGDWEYLVSAKSMVGSAIVMPKSLWCPKSAERSFLILRGEYAKVGNLLTPVIQEANDQTHNLNAPTGSNSFF